MAGLTKPVIMENIEKVKRVDLTYNEKYGADPENHEAQEMAREADLLDIGGVIDIE